MMVMLVLVLMVVAMVLITIITALLTLLRNSSDYLKAKTNGGQDDPEREGINPFTAPACTISGLEDSRTRLQTVYFQSYNTSTFNARRFNANRFTCQYEKEHEKD